MLNNISKSFWFQFVPAVFFLFLGIVLLSTGVIPAYYLVGTFIMWILVCGLGIAVGYHRVFSHKTHTLPTWKENVLLFFATFGGQGSVIFWVALHRGYHHPYSDTERDIHSPVHGKWQAFIGWWLTVTEYNPRINMKYAVDLLRKKNHLWFHNNYYKILWGIPLIIALFDWHLALTAFGMVTGIAVLQDNLVNLLGHLPNPISYRNFDTKDRSQNSIPLAYLTWGQGWHNNHHYRAGSFDFGKGVSGKWWEWDPCRIFLPFLK
jgi:stearoyl-CoA desaturase (delta-9 desaturase)